MMHSTYGGYMSVGALPPSYPYDAFFDHTYTSQMTLPQLSRSSRVSTGQRAGTSMRVVKPTSANNSPRSSMMARRRTMVNDGQTARRHQQALEYISATHDIDASRTKRLPRPVSWHPSTHLQPPQPQYLQQQTTYEFSTPAMYADQQDTYTAAPQYSPMTSYSSNASPSSSFSPLPVSGQAVNTMTHLTADTWQTTERSASSFFPPLNDCQYSGDSFPTLNAGTNYGNALDWNNFIAHGFSTTSPPTPDSFVQTTQQLQPAVSEASIQSFDESEEEGEILVGMGLYDTPDKYVEDPHLNNYRSTVSSLLGSTFRPQEPRGKGLKLEETWEPPKSDDEDEDKDEED